MGTNNDEGVKQLLVSHKFPLVSSYHVAVLEHADETRHLGLAQICDDGRRVLALFDSGTLADLLGKIFNNAELLGPEFMGPAVSVVDEFWKGKRGKL